ncbi:MAG: DUF4395 family protein, partial [Marmoricola sp.]
AVVALAGYLIGIPVVGAVATGFALTAALLNAVLRFCLGCEMYLLIRRFAPALSTITATAGRSGETCPQNPDSKEKVIA